MKIKHTLYQRNRYLSLYDFVDQPMLSTNPHECIANEVRFWLHKWRNDNIKSTCTHLIGYLIFPLLYATLHAALMDD